jgi:hypothetical protein
MYSLLLCISVKICLLQVFCCLLNGGNEFTCCNYITEIDVMSKISQDCVIIVTLNRVLMC